MAEAWAQSRNRGDAEKTCALYTTAIREQLAAGYGSCQAFYKGEGPTNKPGGLLVGGYVLVAVDVRESGDHASGKLVTKNGGLTNYPIELSKQDGNWRVSRFGP